MENFTFCAEIDQADSEILPSIQHLMHLDLAKVPRLKKLTLPYIISYPHFLKLNNISDLSREFWEYCFQ